METLLIILFVPILIPIIAKFVMHKDVTWKELGVVLAVTLFLTSVTYLLGYYRDDGDRAVISGQVTGKERDVVSCSHSYKCHCYTTYHTDSKGVSHSQEHCSTCYDHDFDVDWLVKSTLWTYTISRIDRQGLDQPNRWSIVKVGDPVADVSSYVNYIKAVPESLFHQVDTLKFKKILPAYPDKVYDYYKVNRTVVAGPIKVTDLRVWNSEINEVLKTLGPKKQVNLVVVLAGVSDASFSNALEAHWLGGKKNDVVVVLGVPAYPKIAWVRVFSWSKNKLVNVVIRDEVMSLGTASPSAVVGVASKAISTNFVRRPMKDFEYLRNEVEPPMWVVVFALILGLIASTTLTYLSIKRDLI